MGSRAVQSRGDMEGLPTRAEMSAEFEATLREHARAHKSAIAPRVGASLLAMRPAQPLKI
jgi:dehydrogluconokinase